VSLTLRSSGRGGGNFATTSDNGGGFTFSTVDPGNYSLIGERTGYVRTTYSTQPNGSAAVIEVVSDKTSGGIQLKMTPQAVVVGRVYDQDGDPLQGVSVELWHYTYPRGKKQLSQAQNGSTNDLGEFRVA